MAYFPMFTDLSHKNVLILGGGAVAFRKAKMMLEFEASVTVISLEYDSRFHEISSAKQIVSIWNPDYLKTADLLICASSDHQLNHQAAADAKALRIPVNVVDDAATSTFIFPAVIHQEDLVIGISTSGASPSAAQWLKKQITALIPDHFPKMLSDLKKLRPRVILQISDEAKRTGCFKKLFSIYMDRKQLPESDQIDSILQEWKSL